MGRLIDPGAGEVSDRLSILTLKVLFGRHAGKDTAHFEKERQVLLTKLRAQTLNGKWFEAYSELAAVNAALWHAEDDLRDIRQRAGLPIGNVAEAAGAACDVRSAAMLAFKIQGLNDDRAALIARINTDTGAALGEEKL